MKARTASTPLLAVLLVGCTLFPSGDDDRQRSVYLLAPTPGGAVTGLECGSIQVAPGHGASGFRTARMAYLRAPFQLEYFAYSVWADNPARMLSEAVRADLYASGAFDAVVSTPAATATDLRLDLGDMRVLQRFNGETSSLELEAEARLYAVARPTELLSRRFAFSESAEPNPAGGVRAANAAAQRLLVAVREFVTSVCEGLGAGEAANTDQSP